MSSLDSSLNAIGSVVVGDFSHRRDCHFADPLTDPYWNTC